MDSPSAPSSSRVLITGATGFVGRTLLSTAALPRSRAALRSGAMPELGADQVIVGDIDGQTDWSQALAGVDRVVHLAARVHVMKPSANDHAEFERTNVLGTERLARAAAAAGVERFVYLSSIKVNGESTSDRPFRAADEPRPREDYARSKLEAERRLAAIERASGMAVSIVRSPLVYGPGVRANFLRLLSLAHGGLPIPLASVANVRSMVSVWNLCDLICVLLRHERPVRGVLLVSDGEDISTGDLIRRLARIMHRPARLFSMPAGALRALASLAGRRAEVNRLCDSLAVDIAQTRLRVGWSPPLTLDEGLARTVEWYLRQLADRRAA
jgi:nucleoside-diphosphate-sugar epimerase